jgi:riboflavin biosynthesis pyrimidine reductase
MPASAEVTQLFPERKQVPLEGLYLQQALRLLPGQIGHPLVLTAYITDRNGIVANSNENGQLQVPPEIKNPPDWHLFQELVAQSDLIISGSAYLKRVQASGSGAQDVLSEFEPGQKFEHLGRWRLDHGLKARQPDLAFLTHKLDFQFPPGVLGTDRRVFIFTSFFMADSKEAGALTDAGAVVVGCGETGVDGSRMMDYLEMDSGYHVIMNVTGPSVLALLLEARQLDLLYITEVQREIPFEDPSSVRTILPEGKRVDELEDFNLTYRYAQENITAEDGSPISQEFHRYDRTGLFPQ